MINKNNKNLTILIIITRCIRRVQINKDQCKATNNAIMT